MTDLLLPLTLLLYAVAAVLHFVAFVHRTGVTRAVLSGRVAWLSHTLLLLLHLRAGHEPIVYGPYGVLLLFTWAVVLNYLLLEALLDLHPVGPFLLPVVFALLAYASAHPRVPGDAVGRIAEPWVIVHVAVALAGYAAFALACVAGLLYLLQERQLRAKAFLLLYRRLPSLELLDAVAYRLVVVGFPLLTLAMLMGAIWARARWGGAWPEEPKVLWTFFTWSVYALYLLGRQRVGWWGRKGAYLAVAGFMAVLFNLLVVGTLFSTKHVF